MLRVRGASWSRVERFTSTRGAGVGPCSVRFRAMGVGHAGRMWTHAPQQAQEKKTWGGSGSGTPLI